MRDFLGENMETNISTEFYSLLPFYCLNVRKTKQNKKKNEGGMNNSKLLKLLG
jgi:hypothetical protein